MNSSSSYYSYHKSQRIILGLLFTVFGTVSLHAQTIGGKVVGGGNMGTTDSTTTVIIDEGCVVNDVFGAGNGATAVASDSSLVTIKGGIINGNVYGGGNEAELSGSTTVIVLGGNINQNVYGGGNKAAMTGNTQVTLQGGKYAATSSVFAGARQANINKDDALGIAGDANLVLDGANVADNDTLKVPYVYGGNDVSGNIAGTATVSATDNTTHKLNIMVTDLFAGGNGDYDYTASGFETLSRPDLTTAVLDIQAGKYSRLFGGGNAATVTGSTTIGINNSTVLTGSTDYQFGQVFGGNNKAVMSIRPTWNLTAGYIDNLYGGGNAGDMTNAAGILLDLNSAGIYVNNTYGGCRMAAVDPGATQGVGTVVADTVDGINLPADYAAKVLVRDGHYNNIYGGNDISGEVYYGTDVEIYATTVSGDVYGSGNGSYAYTNQVASSDYYYTQGSHATLVDALFWHRPNVAKARLHFWGTASKPAFVAGNTYCGGNSATIINSDGTASTAEIVLGEHVTLNQFFLGCNGENMKDATILSKYADGSYSSLNLNNSDAFARYMDGCKSTYLPTVTYDWTNGTASTPEQSDVKIGSIYVGGNVGSVETSQNLDLTFSKGLTIYDKIVGGCNNANIVDGTYNAAYSGGVLNGASGTTRTYTYQVNSRLEPRTMASLTRDTRGFITTTTSWDWHTATYTVEGTGGSRETLTTLQGGNIYGGCYQSGSTEGDVIINISDDLISPDVTSSAIADLDKTADYVFSKTFNVFGGGYGADAVIKGNTAINLSGNARVLKVYGGGEMGAVGYNNGTLIGGNTVVTTTSTLLPASTSYNVWRIYGGSFEGSILGNAQLTLLGGKINSAVAGNCNADLAGTASVQIGSAETINTGYPYVTNAVYGGNDFGGLINGTQDKSVDGWSVRSNSYVQYLAGKIDGKVFGGSRGSYDYDTEGLSQHAATTVSGFTKPLMQTVIAAADPSNTKSIGANCFVDIASTSININDKVGSGDGTGFFGGGEGKLNKSALVDVNSSFVLLHAATTQQRYTANAGVLAPNVYGGGYYSVVKNARLEAETGYVNTLYGGTNGASAADMTNTAVNYKSTSTLVNIYGTMDNTALTVFGGGSYVGSDSTKVQLWGGKVQNVYGGSNKEGYCGKTFVNVPASSTVTVNALFGGAKGDSINLPCDVGISNINFNSATAYVSDGIYGGNHNYRATMETNININKSVLKAAGGEFTPIYGAGYGANTIAGYTHVNLVSQVIANKIYGGGREGKVFGAYDDKSGASTYYASNDYAHWAYPELTASSTEHWGYSYPEGWLATRKYNTNVTIPDGATVQNVYGAGYGAAATVSGSTCVNLTGGTIAEDIYGGGEEGNVEQQTSLTLGKGTAPEHQTGNIFTYLNIQGGKVRNVYGGGYNGNVGTAAFAAANTAIEQTRVEIGKDSLMSSTTLTFADGKPTVLRSVYGGGYKGAVYATARVKMYGGYVGYYYDTTDSKFKKQLDLRTSGDNLLKQSGNIYGGGYGEGASTDHSEVTVYDGIVRNSVYGGGEIASVGRASLTPAEIADRTLIPHMTYGGSSKVYMYGGLIEGNVFGGGRGYAVDPYGNTQTGEFGYSDGFTFGTTEVNIYRGTIGTTTSVADGDGNVFGGGNIGYCYSFNGTNSSQYGSKHTGYYYDSSNKTTEDSKVVVTPYARIINNTSLTYGGKTYSKGDYVPTEALNSLSSTASEWASAFGNLDKQGATVGNGIFAGGNVSAGSDKVYANVKTIYGNATASLIDCTSKDLITVGSDGIGGLYGDGNLTFVDGYRELNISNYGTDYYNLTDTISYTNYLRLSNREKAYFELKWKNKSTDVIISDAEYQKLTDAGKANYTAVATCNIYAGRILNTIQRADFCGIFGSRIVLQGAQDRVPSVVDYTNYAINRVKEVSLNQVTSDTTKLGNYLGFYNVVNYLGALTSDVKMTDTRTTDSGKPEHATTGGESYWEWKVKEKGTNRVNNGSSKNQVALCTGVFLEILDEQTESADNTSKKKIYGPITGVVELQLMSVKTGEGGGYVYAKNEHGKPTYNPDNKPLIMTAANANAASKENYTYTNNYDTLETSGNFVNSTARIVDDCYPERNNYTDDQGHYWYIKGNYYVYDQHISAYSGSATLYSVSSNIPLTIDNSAHGTLQLQAIEKNKFAYWDPATLPSQYKGSDSTMVLDGNTYYMGDPISYYEYSQLASDKQSYFIDDVYFCSEKVGSYDAGKVLNKTDYDNIFTGTTTTDSYVCTLAFTSDLGTTYSQGDIITKAAYENEVSYSTNYRQNFLPILECVNTANAVSHDNGYTLSLAWSNPAIWDNYHTLIDPTTMGIGHSGTVIDKTDSRYIISKEAYDLLKETSTAGVIGQDAYTSGPTYNYTGTDTKILGQSSYTVGDVINNETKVGEQEIITYINNEITDQAERDSALAKLAGFDDKAYVAKNDVTIGSKTYTKGSCISKTAYDAMSTTDMGNFSVAYICTLTFQTSDGTYYLVGDVISTEEYNNLQNVGGKDYRSMFSDAWYCTKAGDWGGKVYKQGHNYNAVDYATLPASERASNFSFNKDALSALSQNFVPKLNSTTNPLSDYDCDQTQFSQTQLPDYSAIYTSSTSLNLGSSSIIVSRPNQGKITVNTVMQNDTLSGTVFNGLVNEKAKYAKIAVQGDASSADNSQLKYYVVDTEFSIGNNIYTVGQSFNKEDYDSKFKTDYSSNFQELTLAGVNSSSAIVPYYWCKATYKRPSGGAAIEDYQYTSLGDTITKGTILSNGTYTNQGNLVNQQTNFTISANIPDITSSLVVTKESKISELRKDRIVTYDYVYTYEEAEDVQGTSYATVSEHHIVNVTIHFEGGQPTIGVLLPPSIVMPGTKIGLNQPGVSKGAFEVLGGGWEMYASKDDAEAHTNPLTYVNNETPLNWYNNGYYVAYYAKSYLGKTYSNAVQLSVANYHRLSDVLNSTHDDGTGTQVNDYMYIDNAAKEGKVRNSKIYINSKEELDGLATLFTLSQADTTLTHVKGCKNLEFIIQSDIDHTGSTWTSIGDATHCFEGNIHGDGYTISGLDHSLFGKLCGDVYNIGVTGSFTGAGVADDGDGNVTNAWVSSTAQPVSGMYPILGTGNGLAINCYYPETMNYKSTSGINGWTVNPKSATAFLDGEVAYNLNSFYLNKRYARANGGTYPTGAEQYVENFYYGNEDYIYSLGSIPLVNESRWNATTATYDPVYPDDYLFFGQKLTYGLMFGATNQSQPASVKKKDVATTTKWELRRLDNTADIENRVLRAPGYYRSKDKQAVYFNTDANFIGNYSSKNVYNKLTAIDFTGYNDTQKTTSASQQQFYLPMLDIQSAENLINDTITGYVKKENIRSINFNGLTKNLLVYGDPTGDAATYSILSTALPEPTMSISGSPYYTIDAVDSATQATILGHLVDKQTDGSYMAVNDHYLVDKESFNCPITYTFNTASGSETCMWYQRTPDVYSDGAKGWESICLPFSAYMVTTQDKGEITHFYGQSSADHEYWLRGFCNMQEIRNAENIAIPTAMFYRPQSLNDSGYNYRYEFAPASAPYEVENTFLWDYYYSNAGAAREDENSDTYQQGYYNTSRTYQSYPYYTAEIPYIISFPGETFYEFDLSGEYQAQFTGASIPKLDKQVITFCSKDGQTIAVSDDEDRQSAFRCQGTLYTYEGTYLPDTLTTANYKLDATGAQFDQITATDIAVPFRAYYSLSKSSNAAPRYIALGIDLPYQNQNTQDDKLLQGIKVTVKDRIITVQSGLDHNQPVTIVNADGARIAQFTITPGETVSTLVYAPGVYMAAGHKVMVR